MTGQSDSSQNQGEKPKLGFGEQIVVTLAILMATVVVFGGIWLLDTIAH